jgi:carbon storage regulator
MLVLSRKLNETIVIDGSIRITVVGVRGNQVRLGIEAPDRVRIYREELCLPDRAAEGGAATPSALAPLRQYACSGR